MSTLRRFAPLIAILGMLGLATLTGVVLTQENDAPEIGPQVATVNVGESPRSSSDTTPATESGKSPAPESGGKQAGRPASDGSIKGESDPPSGREPVPVHPAPAPAPAPAPQPQPPLNYQPYYGDDDDWDDDDWDDDDDDWDDDWDDDHWDD